MYEKIYSVTLWPCDTSLLPLLGYWVGQNPTRRCNFRIQDKAFAPLVCCKTYVEIVRKWIHKKKNYAFWNDDVCGEYPRSTSKTTVCNQSINMKMIRRNPIPLSTHIIYSFIARLNSTESSAYQSFKHPRNSLETEKISLSREKLLGK